MKAQFDIKFPPRMEGVAYTPGNKQAHEASWGQEAGNCKWVWGSGGREQGAGGEGGEAPWAGWGGGAFLSWQRALAAGRDTAARHSCSGSCSSWH